MTPQSAQRHLDRILALLAGTQHGVVAWWQLREAGVPRDALKDRLERGGLHRVHRGVYAVGHAHLSPEGRRMAAVLAIGPDAVLSHRSAAEHRGLLRPGAAATLHVSVLGRTGRRCAGIVVHRAPHARWSDHDGIPTTTVAWTLLDLAACARRSILDAAIEGAVEQRLFDLREIEPLLAGRRAGTRALREAIAAYDDAPVRSELERRFLELCRRHGIPRPQVNVVVEGYLVDFYWPAAGLIVETDGSRHRGGGRMEDDQRRDAAHALAGLRTHRFGWRQVVHEPDIVARVVRALLAGQSMGSYDPMKRSA